MQTRAEIKLKRIRKKLVYFKLFKYDLHKSKFDSQNTKNRLQISTLTYNMPKLLNLNKNFLKLNNSDEREDGIVQNMILCDFYQSEISIFNLNTNSAIGQLQPGNTHELKYNFFFE